VEEGGDRLAGTSSTILGGKRPLAVGLAFVRRSRPGASCLVSGVWCASKFRCASRFRLLARRSELTRSGRLSPPNSAEANLLLRGRRAIRHLVRSLQTTVYCIGDLLPIQAPVTRGVTTVGWWSGVRSMSHFYIHHGLLCLPKLAIYTIKFGWSKQRYNSRVIVMLQLGSEPKFEPELS